MIIKLKWPYEVVVKGDELLLFNDLPRQLQRPKVERVELADSIRGAQVIKLFSTIRLSDGVGSGPTGFTFI